MPSLFFKYFLKPLGGLALALLLGLGFLGCSSWNGKDDTPGPEDKVYTVSLASVVEREIPNSIQAEGPFIPLSTLELKSDFSGKVQALSVEEGQSVYAGDVLMKIEDEKLPWVLERQRAQLGEAQAQLELDEKLAAGGSYEENEDEEGDEEEEYNEEPEDEEEYDEGEEEEEYDDEEGGQTAAFRRLARLRRQAARARRRNQQAKNQSRPATTPTPRPAISPEVAQSREVLNQAKVERIRAEISETERQLEGATITSGIDGIIVKVGVAEGTLVKPGDLLAEIVTLDPIDLRLRINSEDIGKIDKKMKVKVTVADLDNRIYEGEISFIGAAVDPAQKNVEIRVRLTNRDEKIKIGMEGLANIALAGGSHEAMLVPREAIVQRQGRTYLYVQEAPQLAERVEVRVGSAFENMMEIKSGIDEDERIIVNGAQKLKDEEEFIKVK